MRKLSHFLTKQSFQYLVSIPKVFAILKNWAAYIKSFISGNITISELHFQNWYIYPIRNFDDLWVFYEIFIQKEYGKISSKDKIIIDIGANNGLFMLYCKYQYPEAIIHCFEPVPECVANIQTLIDINTLQNVFVHEIAISDKEGKESIFLDNQTIAATLHKNIAWGTKEIIVTTSTLSKQTALLDISHINILKMDCEWSEYEIIDSIGTEFLNTCDKIMIEWHNIDNTKTWKKLYEQLQTKAHHTYIDYKKHAWHWNNWFIKAYK